MKLRIPAFGVAVSMKTGREVHGHAISHRGTVVAFSVFNDGDCIVSAKDEDTGRLFRGNLADVTPLDPDAPHIEIDIPDVRSV